MSKISNLSKSPDRGSFRKESYQKKLQENPNDESAKQMMEYYEDFDRLADEREQDPEWQKNNLEYDLRVTDWILEKVRESEVYAQNLYAALCNNDFQKLEVVPVLKDQRWGCSWRYAGGIIAHMRQEGDYIDWYCSGIRGDALTPEEFDELTEDKKEKYLETQAFVGEGVVTDEIRKDLKQLGWVVLEHEK